MIAALLSPSYFFLQQVCITRLLCAKLYKLSPCLLSFSPSPLGIRGLRGWEWQLPVFPMYRSRCVGLLGWVKCGRVSSRAEQGQGSHTFVLTSIFTHTLDGHSAQGLNLIMQRRDLGEKMFIIKYPPHTHTHIIQTCLGAGGWGVILSYPQILW